MKRRDFVRSGIALATFSNLAFQHPLQDRITQITTGASQHWFGYYDKWQIDKSGRYALGGQVDAFFRSPQATDKLKVGLIDLQLDNSWEEIGSSTSWGWQQGCMLQWIPGSNKECIWNDHGKDGFVSKIYNIETRQVRTLPMPIYTLSPDGDFALCVDPGRLQFFRPGYGYPTIDPVEKWAKAPADTGIFRMDLQTGEVKLILSLAQIAEIQRPQGSVAENYHWFNHLLINPSGTRFIFLNRSRPVASTTDMRDYVKTHPEWKGKGFSSSYVTRAMTANVDGTEVYPLNDSGMFSHFIWNGDDKICAWAVPEQRDKAAFYDFTDLSKKFITVGKDTMKLNGHNTYVPNTNYEWILNDTYPQGPDRLQELYLYHVPSNRKVSLGKFHQPPQFKGEWRCDLHPRCDQAGKRVFFDSTHIGDRRQMYMVEIGEIVGS